ncbi:hypothetical protein KC352_g14462, partial [Hortaea werneckii]
MASVTPQRRSRNDDDEESEISVDGESRHSTPNKRVRRSYDNEDSEEDATGGDEGDEGDDGDGDGDGDEDSNAILPDSFRRSPKGKRRAAPARPPTGEPGKHQPGSIV